MIHYFIIMIGLMLLVTPLAWMSGLVAAFYVYRYFADGSEKKRTALADQQERQERRVEEERLLSDPEYARAYFLRTFLRNHKPGWQLLEEIKPAIVIPVRYETVYADDEYEFASSERPREKFYPSRDTTLPRFLGHMPKAPPYSLLLGFDAHHRIVAKQRTERRVDIEGEDRSCTEIITLRDGRRLLVSKSVWTPAFGEKEASSGYQWL